MRVLVAVDGPRGEVLADGLARERVDVLATVPASALAHAAAAVTRDADRVASSSTVVPHVAEADAIVLHVTRHSLTADVVALCDRLGARILPLCDTDADTRLAEAFGLGPAMTLDAEPWRIAEMSGSAPAPIARRAVVVRAAPVIAVWGPAGAPGRSTVAIELAMELARGDRRVGLVDADTHAPSIALALGMADEGPGFAAACRQAALGGLDSRELTRISTPLEEGVEVLTGINRPSRWPELGEARVTTALAACRDWVDHTVIDVSSSLERDEEIMSDLSGPRRNAATLASLCAADLVVAVAGADPVGIARFIRGYADLRAAIGSTRVVVVANRLRPGSLGVDARGQIRRALDRFAGIEDAWFLPADPRAADAALLAARPIASVAPRSSFTLALRRFVGEAVAPVAANPADPDPGPDHDPGRERRRGLRRRVRPAHEVDEQVRPAGTTHSEDRIRL
ncbi:AAA family ATPase [Microbacterium rhizomatis]|uniref:P-loop NTPase n=1 Tax=Microbacterium rhizomatis TaxID=1631477 RepID=A0A5J5J8R8_9MICO|nr:P-loop NTPase [Microbacterium rhizomatis]KAA9111193.1 P-loop NTPase [Microbacterium rhizomatis]